MIRVVAITVASVAIHVVIAAVVAAVDRPEKEEEEVIEVEIETIPPPKVEVPKIEPPKVVEPEPEPEPVKAPPPPTAKVAKSTPRATKVSTEAKATTTETTEASDAEPTEDGVGGGATKTIVMEDLGGSEAVATGKKKRSGTGTGTGKGKGKGGGAGSGTGTAPVSVASIKAKAKPKGDYGFLDAGDDYPAEARKLEIEGQIKVRLLVSAEGKVTKATLLNKLGHGLDELALARAKKIEFEPAIDTDDKPVASVVVWTFTFTLPGS